MTIGVDLRVLQVGHQFRGIGEVTKQCLNRIFVLAMRDEGRHPDFVFYRYDGEPDPKDFLDIPKDLSYREISLGARPRPELKRSALQKLQQRWRIMFGRSIPGAGVCDVLLQFQYDLGVPRRPRTVLVAHDLIPYIFWDDYFTSPWVHFKHRAARTMLRTMLDNYEFVRVLKRTHRAARRIVCVSESTSRDLQTYLHVPARKLRVAHLGVSLRPVRTGAAGHHRAKGLPTKPFLLFVGAVDPRRRRIDDLVAAFNNLKAAGHDIQLVLAGENFQSAESIPNEIARKAVMESSYRDDILLLGYINDETKQELYRKATAFVFPTTYEGFGIPILEAMLMECPVISYKNSSIPEVGGNYALYAKNWSDIQAQVLKLLAVSAKKRQSFVAAAKAHAEQFSWDKTSAIIYEELIKTAR